MKNYLYFFCFVISQICVSTNSTAQVSAYSRTYQGQNQTANYNWNLIADVIQRKQAHYDFNQKRLIDAGHLITDDKLYEHDVTDNTCAAEMISILARIITIQKLDPDLALYDVEITSIENDLYKSLNDFLKRTK